MGRGPARDAYLSALEALVAEERESGDEPEPEDPIDELIVGLEVAS